MAPVAPGASLLLHVQPGRTSQGRRVKDHRQSFGGHRPKVDSAVALRSAWQVVPPPWAVGEVECDAKAGYLDRKWALRGEAESGWLSLQFEVKTKTTCFLAISHFFLLIKKTNLSYEFFST
jgi:hypothetical protein